ncbi:DUF1489 domain-containing protein [Kordiimonas aquimaris]|uniref:DUF1489 domain-containing protein n=1 Tax=Kordiimonas aquimaris TaxID=707591 RepID=UPI0021D01748|nr:DUF1489 domain-containing protein [Kordiimonas aquimaris]
MTLHILKVAAGTSSVEELERVVARYSFEDPELGHVMAMSSRNTPQRRDELLDGGSVFWIIKRQVVARASLVDIRSEERLDGRKGCQMCIIPKVIRTVPQAKNGFQGWRYFQPENAPADLITGDSEAGTGSPELAAELQTLGLL